MTHAPGRPSSRTDPRLYQISVLTALLAYGVARLRFEAPVPRIGVILVVTLATQYVCTRLWRLPAFDPRSPLISGLSLCLLLRTESLGLAAAAALLAVASKFVLRAGTKHVFNPTNFALVALLLSTSGAWVSPGQWGNAAFFGFLVACLGGLVVNRAARSDVTWAFLGSYAALLLCRALYVGERLAVPVHRLENGALLLFAFFMISDPKTTPDSRPGRILFGFLVAVGAAWVQFGMYRTNGLLWSLAFLSPLVPLLDRLLPGSRYQWPGTALPLPVPKKEYVMMNRARLLAASGLALSMLVVSSHGTAWGFCGFYVARADASLFNRASRVVMVRDADHTVLTMSSDYQGDPREFALVIPVPVVLERGQIHVGDPAVLDHLDAYSAPRLTEYFDEDPCGSRAVDNLMQAVSLKAGVSGLAELHVRGGRAGEVKIEARYTVSEYDILILSARESGALMDWLHENGYRVPARAEPVIRSYIRQGLHFFVARVNMQEKSKLGFTYLRPLQIAYDSPRFMLPLRLGMVNADGPQELFVYALTRNGRAEATNYRTVRLPTGAEVPLCVRASFPDFYRDMFRHQVERGGMSAVFLEYAWDMGLCDPCASPPLSAGELRQLGVYWVDDSPAARGGVPVFITRLHVRYDAAHFPEDLAFQETGSRERFQSLFVLRHPWTRSAGCGDGRGI